MKIQNSKSNAANGMLSVVAGTLIAFLLLLAPIAVHGQNYAGSVRGTVTDPSGAAVAGATVTLRDVGSNATVQTKTSELGDYSFSAVNVGVYEMTVKASSFKEFIAKNVEVHVSTTTEVNAKLELGASSEVVTVEASDIQVQTTTADVGGVIEGTQVRELPLNGRNFMALTQLQPGVSANNGFNTKDKGLQGGADFSVNGNPSTNNLFLIDGVNNNDVGSNRTILIYPSVDSVAEFKMLTNSYGPEYGQASGAIISITTRSGENQFHGGAFYEGRNDKLNANNFANNTFAPGTTAHQKPPLRRNDYGYFVSGPIKKDKLFFWWNEEWNKDVRGNLVTTCVPTAAERAGDFSADVTAQLAALNAGTPTSGNPNPTTTCNAPPPANFNKVGGVWTATSNIPVASRAAGNPYAIANPDAVGQLLAAYYPAASQTPANYGTLGGSDLNYAQNVPTRAPWREENVRVDYNLTKKNAITFRYTQDAWSIPAPNNAFGWGDDPFATYQGSWNQPSKSILGRLTSQISNTLINDFEFGYAHNAIIISAQGSGNPGLSAQFDKAFQPIWPASGKTPGGIPTVWGGLQHYGNFASIWAIVGYNNDMSLYTYQDNVTKIQGTHAWKFGAVFSANHKNENQFGGGDRPQFGINDVGWGNIGIVTGNALANVLLPGTGPNPQTIAGISETNINPVDHGKWHDLEFYAGDTWKIKRNVTLTYGFRWSFLREPYDDDNRMASFSLAAYNPARPAADACNGVILVPGTNFCTAAAAASGLPLSAGTPGVNRALINNNNHNIAPRLGVAWDVFGTGKTALRFGGGQFYQRERVSPQVGLSNTAPFAIGANVTRSLDTAPSLAGASTSPSGGRSPRGVAPNSWQWNVSVEQQVARNTSLQVGYVGNVGIHQTTTYDINQVPESGLGLGAFLGASAQGASFTSGPAGPVGTTCPQGGTFNAGACAYTTPSINSLRPASNFAGIVNYFSRDGHSSYHALQVQFRSKLRNFSSVQAAYTWSHTIADFEQDAANGGGSQGSFTDVQNRSADRGNATINRPHIFVFNEVFFLPKLAHQNAFVRESVGGWELNTIFTAESGNSITVYQTGASAAGLNSILHIQLDPAASPLNCTDSAGNKFPCGISSLSGTGYTNTQRPSAAPGTSCNSGVSGNQIFNPNAFTLIGMQIGTIGSAPRGACHGPHYVNGDIGIYKNWKVKEKYGLRFSVDFFNAFNHSNFDATYIQGTGGNNGSGVWAAAGGAVYCGPSTTVMISGVPWTQYEPCGTSNRVVSAYANGTTTNGANPGFGSTIVTKPNRELQYGLKFTF